MHERAEGFRVMPFDIFEFEFKFERGLYPLPFILLMAVNEKMNGNLL